MDDQTIKEVTLRELLQTAHEVALRAEGRANGFALAARSGRSVRLLSTSRGSIRLFPNLTTLAAYLQRLGVSRFDVDTSHYSPGRARSPRPDRAEALKRTRTRPIQIAFFEKKA